MLQLLLKSRADYTTADAGAIPCRLYSPDRAKQAKLMPDLSLRIEFCD